MKHLLAILFLIAALPALPAEAPVPAPIVCPHCGKTFVPGLPAGPDQTNATAPGPLPNTNSVLGHVSTPGSPPANDVIVDIKPKPPIGLILGIALPLLSFTGGLAAWFLWWQPRKRRAPLIEALTRLARDDEADFAQIEKLLAQALTAGLKPADVAEARFGLAFVRARLGKFAEAESILADSETASEPDTETAYLRFWLLARQRKHDEVERFYEQHAARLGDLLDSKRIAGITFLHLARQHWTRKEASTALGYFERLRALNVLTDQIPQHIGDQRLVFGLMALFEQNWAKAREHFTAARETAQNSTQPTHIPELGLLLCDWREQETPDIDARLLALLPAVRQARSAAPPSAPPPGGEKKAESAPTDEPTLLLMGCLLWHTLSLLFVWLNRPARQPLAEPDWEELRRRLKDVKEIAPTLGDPHLIEGLLDYYFAGDDHERRQAALKVLDNGVEREVSVPEVLLLLERERELEKRHREGLATYLNLVKAWLQDQGVPLALREEVRRQLLALSSRFREPLDGLSVTEAADTAPSVADMQSRILLLHRRVNEIVQPRLKRTARPAAGAAVSELLKDVGQTTSELQKTAQTLETKEQKLMLVTGEFLLNEEPPAESQGSEEEQDVSP